MSMRQDFVNKAISYLGRNEADGSHKAIIDLYNSITPLPVGYKVKYTDDWCAAFVSAVAKACGMTALVFPECGCERMIKLYQKAERWQENDAHSPLPGDIIFYDWQDSGNGDNRGFSDHVGIVVSVSGQSMNIIEGNRSNKVCYRNIAVNSRYIRGYGVPDFDKGASTPKTENAATELPVASGVKFCSVSLQQLSKGAKGADVKSMQHLLIGFGYSCGSAGADGDFGSGTLAALKNIQKAKGLTIDGVCGQQTWSRLLRG